MVRSVRTPEEYAARRRAQHLARIAAQPTTERRFWLTMAWLQAEVCRTDDLDVVTEQIRTIADDLNRKGKS